MRKMSYPKELCPLSTESTFKSLPTEIHLQIASYLCYPDALALKHTDGYFYRLVRTDVPLKVDWLIERGNLKLPIPGKSYSFRSDEVFCRGEVRTIMERRRWHQECNASTGGCLVVGGSTCGGASLLKLFSRGRLGCFFQRRGLSVEGQVLAAAVVICCLAIIWKQQQLLLQRAPA